MNTDTEIDVLEEIELDESLKEPIYCESLWCKAHGKNPHHADWYWLAPCRQGTMAVCNHRRKELVVKKTNYYCDPGCRSYHSPHETDWIPIS
jgi:hypothetical protein